MTTETLPLLLLPLLCCAAPDPLAAVTRAATASPARAAASAQGSFYAAPDARSLAAEGGMRAVIDRWRVDRQTLRRFFDLEGSALRRARLADFTRSWVQALSELPESDLTTEGRIDWLLLRGELDHDLRALELDERRWTEMADLLPFAGEITGLQEARRRFEPVEPREVATRLARLTEAVDELSERVQPDDRQPQTGDEGEGAIHAGRIVADRAADAVRDLRRALEDWYRFHADFDPLFTWWVEEPWRALDGALERFHEHLREEVAGLDDDDDTIVGDPIGREALLGDLAHERIPYTPEELVEIADAEMAWCRERMDAATRALGFDDWKAALEHVKTLHVGPGEQPRLVRELAEEAIAFLEQRELLTIPELAKRTWRMEMMSPERQKLNPFFLGGESVIVAFPTGSMAHSDKLMSLRANNVHFSRAVVHHELIPGHNLQHFMQARHATHRRPFATPFWGEGWALYWELRLWDLGFARGPEDEVGMLFWRMHRCARIRFSLSFHLGTMTPEECVDLLVDQVGHERASAEGEVRRSFQGGYSPLYQCAYMLGGLQLRALHGELVDSGRMSERAFHDAILRQGSMPIELVRAALTGEVPPRDAPPGWRFYD